MTHLLPVYLALACSGKPIESTPSALPTGSTTTVQPVPRPDERAASFSRGDRGPVLALTTSLPGIDLATGAMHAGRFLEIYSSDPAGWEVAAAFHVDETVAHFAEVSRWPATVADGGSPNTLALRAYDVPFLCGDAGLSDAFDTIVIEFLERKTVVAACGQRWPMQRWEGVRRWAQLAGRHALGGALGPARAFESACGVVAIECSLDRLDLQCDGPDGPVLSGGRPAFGAGRCFQQDLLPPVLLQPESAQSLVPTDMGVEPGSNPVPDRGLPTSAPAPPPTQLPNAATSDKSAEER